MRFSQPCPCCGRAVTYARLIVIMSPRFLRCPNGRCHTRLTFGVWDYWYWSTNLLAAVIGLAGIPWFLATSAGSRITVLLVICLASVIPYFVAALYVMSKVDLAPRDGCPEFILPTL